MEEKRLFLTLEQALDVLPKGEEIHCFVNAGFGLIGADWNKDKVKEITVRKNIEEIHQNFEIKAEEKLKVINEKRRLIKEKFLRVIKRIAELADGRKNAMKDTELEKTIQAKLKNLKLNLNDSSEIKKKLDTISTVPSDIYSSESTEQEKDIIKSMSRERMTKNKAMIENMKHLVSVTFENLKSNIATIRGIRNDLDYYKANQHFK